MTVNWSSKTANNVAEGRKVFVDARCLQRTAYRKRGIGHHSTALLKALRVQIPTGTNYNLIGVIDGGAGALLPEHSALFHELRAGPPPAVVLDDIFISLAPMTEDPIWLDEVLNHSTGQKIAILYDLIPLEFPDIYLSSANARRQYLTCLKSLTTFDRIAAISDHTLRQLLAIAPVEASRVFVTGVAFRSTLMSDLASDDDLPSDFEGVGGRSIAVAFSGDDRRKNLATVLRAHARNAAFAGLPLYVVGGCLSEDVDVAAEEKKNSSHAPTVIFCDFLDDSAFVTLLRRAVIAIVPSRSEGFSMPVIEASGLGSVVVASDIPCHRELIGEGTCFFKADDVDDLSNRVQDLVLDEVAWRRERRAQKDVWRRFTEEAVGERFRQGLKRGENYTPPQVAVSTAKKPRLAFVTPLPPAKSGVADYSMVTLKALSEHAEVHIFSETSNPHRDVSWQTLSPVGSLKYVRRNFDRVVCVLGNSDNHLKAFKYLLEFGGAAILHDARMLNFYYVLLGRERAIALDKLERGEDIESDIDHLLVNQHELKTLFLSEILACAKPVIVHSRLLRDKIRSIYKFDTKLLPFAQYRGLVSLELNAEARAEARRRLDIPSREILVCTFGGIVSDKAPEIILWVARLLESWGVKTRLVFCGPCDGPVKAHLMRYASMIDLTSEVGIFDGPVDETVYRDHLLATDCAIQLRTHSFGSVSGGLGDCIEYAVPSVANESLAGAMETPGFVRIVPDDMSPVLIAEAVLEIIGGGQHIDRPVQDARAFAATHSPDFYARQLLQALDLGTGSP